jgi:hypothetical protein
MLTNTLKWRLSFGADGILAEQLPSPPSKVDFSRIGFLHKTDSEGCPVTYNLYGGLDNAEVFGNLDRFVRWRVQLMERGIALLDFVNHDQMVQVHDYDGVSFWSYDKSAKAASKAVTQIMQDNYPEFLGE